MMLNSDRDLDGGHHLEFYVVVRCNAKDLLIIILLMPTLYNTVGHSLLGKNWLSSQKQIERITKTV